MQHLRGVLLDAREPAATMRISGTQRAACRARPCFILFDDRGVTALDRRT
jgi:hypothetical protein